MIFSSSSLKKLTIFNCGFSVSISSDLSVSETIEKKVWKMTMSSTFSISKIAVLIGKSRNKNDNPFSLRGFSSNRLSSKVLKKFCLNYKQIHLLYLLLYQRVPSKVLFYLMKYLIWKNTGICSMIVVECSVIIIRIFEIVILVLAPGIILTRILEFAPCDLSAPWARNETLVLSRSG